MNRRPRLVTLLAAVLLASLAGPAAVAQDSFLPIPPGQIESIIELLDAVGAAESAILETGEYTERDLDSLRELTAVADAFGAEDLAARSRTLLMIATGSPAAVPAQEELEATLTPGRPDGLIRGSERFTAIGNIVTATGVTALALSATFYALAEQNYRYWLNPPPGSTLTQDQRFEAYKGYEYLSLGMGGAALLTVGIGLPTLYSAAAPESTRAMPLLREAFTAAERDDRLRTLYLERSDIVNRLNRLGDRDPRRDLARTIGMTAGIAGAISAVTMFYIAEETYQEYLDAPLSDDAERLGRRVRFFDFAAIVSGLASASGFGTAVGIDLFTRDREELDDALRSVNTRIIEVRTAPIIDVPAEATRTPADESASEGE